MHAIFRFQSPAYIYQKITIIHQQLRNVSALYITGDKAKENYATLHPYMDFGNIQLNWKQLEYSILKRNCQKNINLTALLHKYNAFKDHKDKIEKLEKNRELVATKLRDLGKKAETSAEEIEQLKSQGKQLRQQQKKLKESFYPIEDDFSHAYLDIPNVIHRTCAIDGKEKLMFRSGLPPDAKRPKGHLEHTDLIRFINRDRYYMFKEAAKFDIFATQALTRYFVDEGDFLQTANPDFVRCVLLEANATPIDQYHKVIEAQLQDQLNYAYLAGGASFESFLAGVTRLLISPNVLPMRLVCCGRIYEKLSISSDTDKFENIFTATQTNAVQSFVATETAQEADEQFEEILNLSVNFYKSLGIHFRVVYADATQITPSEALRASIEVFSPVEKRYVCVGRLSNFGDYVSKRILFCMRHQKQHRFPHMVGGPIMFTSRLIGAMIENEVPLDCTKLLGEHKARKGIDEFKNIFQ